MVSESGHTVDGIGFAYNINRSSREPELDFEDLVFTSPFGKHVNDTAINSDMQNIVCKIRESGVEFKHIYPHVLRHTFATRGLERGIPPKVMQELLGHTSITMTLDIYSHVLPDTKAKEIQKLANLYENTVV